MTRWQDDIKDNIMEPILVRHKYTRAYKDGEKHHMSVEVYKRTMAEKDAILDAARKEAEDIVEKALEELDELKEEKEYLIKGNGEDPSYNMPYEDWSIEALKAERDFYINADSEETSLCLMSIPQLMEKDTSIREEIKELEEKKASLWTEYNKLSKGYDREDGVHMLGYGELKKRREELAQDPKRVLETEEGQKVLEEAKEEIIESVQETILQNAVTFVKTKIFDEFRKHFIDLMYDAIDKMLVSHWIKLNDSDRNILTKAVDKCISVVSDVLHLDKEIAQNIQEHLPDRQDIEQEVNRVIQRPRGRGK